MHLVRIKLRCERRRAIVRNREAVDDVLHLVFGAARVEDPVRLE